MPNIRFLRAEAKAFLTGAIAPQSVRILHLYFPDPWPKRRHHTRRVMTVDFMRLLHSRLVPRGLLEIATDHADYYESMKKTIAMIVAINVLAAIGLYFICSYSSFCMMKKAGIIAQDCPYGGYKKSKQE